MDRTASPSTPEKDSRSSMTVTRSDEAPDTSNIPPSKGTAPELSIIQDSNSVEDVQSLNRKREPPIVKGCFIATAAMGSAIHPHVELLREFRDGFLLKSKYRSTFENLLDKYYRISPPIANKMNKHRFLKLVLRYSLVYPIVFGIKGILPVIDIVLGIKKDVKTNQAG